MDYEYDVFISYRGTNIGKYWVSNYFEPCLREELSEVLGRTAKIYYDKKNISAGKNWPDELKRALTVSKCLVPVLSGTYFGSEWCSREFAVIHHRQEKCGVCSPTLTDGIIVPILVRDGDHLPELAKNIQHIKMHDYYTACEAFKASPDYRKFEKEIMELSKCIDQAIDVAPDHDSNWINEHWSNPSIDELFSKEGNTINMNPILK